MLASMERELLIVWHSRTGAAEAMARAAAEGAAGRARLLHAAEAQPHDLLTAGGYLFACPENLASMSGLMKEMFDRCYYPVLGQLEGRQRGGTLPAVQVERDARLAPPRAPAPLLLAGRRDPARLRQEICKLYRW